jgi:thiosulfate/3-mercaptopyruvate sulfurtransferase
VADGDILISVDELAAARAAVGDAGAGTGRPAFPVMLDVRWRLGGPSGRDLYAQGHIPGAVFADLDRDLAAAPGRGGRHPLPAEADFQEAMRRLGVSDGRPVVVYDDADSTAAARAWWLLRYFGHPDVRVLDGGFRAWTAAGRPAEAGEPGPAAGRAAAAGPGDAAPGSAARGDFTARPGQLPLMDAAAAAALARYGILLDARSAERYRGEVEPVDPVAGHIPGAVSAPTAQNVNPDGTFRPASELAARFAALGIPASVAPVRPAPAAPAATAAPDATASLVTTGSRPAPGVGVYCGSGVTAAHEVLALALAGIPAALYAGSWSEWITDPRRPVATGPGPS